MPSFIVHEDSAAQPATHALLVGVGRYPHLIGGGDDLPYAKHGGMGQLTSPPLSAVEFAKWLISSFKYPAKPLGSVALLAAGVDDIDFIHPNTHAVTTLEDPTFANLRVAAREWKARGDSSPENLMLFFFCGHGIAHGPDQALLLQDFGGDPDAALDSALDFRRFHLGMECCRARHQCFFIDACRTADSNIIDAAGYAGQPIFTPTTRRDRELPMRQKPAFYSTFAGERAQSRTSEISLFTDALLRAFEGGGADNTEGEWWIDTNQLQKTVQFMMDRAHEQGFPRAQISPVDHMSMFPLHQLAADPVVPVAIGCRPASWNEQATLFWSRHGEIERRPPEDKDWDTVLQLGDYTFGAQLPPGQPAPQPEDRNIRPPYRRVHLEVTS